MVSPIYHRIKTYILEQIHSGIWRVGSSIESENELAQRFGVSRMTVNRAVNELTSDGILERRKGSGTFVAQKQFCNTFITVHNIRQDIEMMGKTYRAEQRKKELVPYQQLPNSAKKIFHKGQKIFNVEIIHFGDDVPLQLERRWVDINIVPDFKDQNFNVISATDYLIKQVPLIRGRYWIEAVTMPTDIASALNTSSSQPALRLSRYTYSKESVLTFVEMWHDGGNFSFSGSLE